MHLPPPLMGRNGTSFSNERWKICWSRSVPFQRKLGETDFEARDVAFLPPKNLLLIETYYNQDWISQHSFHKSIYHTDSQEFL